MDKVIFEYGGFTHEDTAAPWAMAGVDESGALNNAKEILEQGTTLITVSGYIAGHDDQACFKTELALETSDLVLVPDSYGHRRELPSVANYSNDRSTLRRRRLCPCAVIVGMWAVTTVVQIILS